MKSIGRVLCLLALVAGCVLTTGTNVYAQDLGLFGWGVRGGGSLDPDQIVVGVHVDLGTITENLYFRPNLEFGFGDDAETATLNAAFHYHFDTKWERWEPYAGGEAGINYIEVDLPNGFDADDTEPAINGVFGIDTETTNGDRLLFELKIGLIEEPDFKLLAGWTF